MDFTKLAILKGLKYQIEVLKDLEYNAYIYPKIKRKKITKLIKKLEFYFESE